MFDVVMVVFQAMITYHLHRHMNPHHNQPLSSTSHSKFTSIYLIYKFSQAPVKNYNLLQPVKLKTLQRIQLSLQSVEN